jgi:hypothetical protein
MVHAICRRLPLFSFAQHDKISLPIAVILFQLDSIRRKMRRKVWRLFALLVVVASSFSSTVDK